MYSATKRGNLAKKSTRDLKDSVDLATTIFEDNQGCIALAKHPVYHTRTKHIDIKFHFLREVVARDIIALEYKPAEEMVADGFTKTLSRDKHAKFLKSLGMAM